MLVQEVMNTDVVVAAPDATVAEVARLMAEHGVGTVVIVEDCRPVGIVTDRDIVLQHVVPDHQAASPIHDVMTSGGPDSGLVTIPPDMDLLDAAAEMGRRRVGRLPVVEDGQLIGILSARDVARELHRALDGLLAKGGKPVEG